MSSECSERLEVSPCPVDQNMVASWYCEWSSPSSWPISWVATPWMSLLYIEPSTAQL